MRFNRKNGLYRPEYYMGCMGVDTAIPPKRSLVSAVRKGVMTPAGGGGNTGGSSGSSGGSGTFGNQNTEASGAVSEDVILGNRFQNLTGGTGTTATIALYIHADTATTTAKVAIYDDAAGSPNTLLGVSSEFNPSAYASGWYNFAITLGANTIANNAYYWLVMWGGASALTYVRAAAGGTHFYKVYDYSDNTGTFPAAMAEDGTGVNLQSIHCDITW